MMKVLVLGNPLLKEDSLPLKLLPALRKEFPTVEFDEADPADIDDEKSPLVIIDTANVKGVTLVEDANYLEDYKLLSAHGLGLAEMLALMKAAGKQVQVKIICVPEKMTQKKVLADVSVLLRAIVP